MPRILVIDDQKDVRAMIAIVLRVRHFEVVEAQSAAAGLKAFEESPFDLAIVDVFLQDACGFDVIARMRDIIPDLPVVAISGMTTTLDAAPQSAELLNVVCLQKPFRPNDLTAAIDEARRRVQQGGERASMAQAG
jgi:DNA-binding response OmpR family regulator